MNLNEYTQLLSKPESVNDRQTLALEEIVNQFPYFQSARALRLKGLYNQSSFQYNYGLKVTAAYTTDRSVLFDFITSDTFTAIHKGLYEQKLAELYGIEVKGSEWVTKKGASGSADASGTKQTTETGLDKVEQSILTSIRESETPFEEETMTDAIPHEETIEIQPEVIIPEPVETIAVVEEFVAAPEKVIAIDEITDVVEHPEAANEIAVTEEIVAEPVPETPNTETELGEVTQDDAELSAAKLEIGRPLEFSKDERHSFQEWLQLSRIQPINREESIAQTEQPSEAELERLKKKEMIDQFIKANPKIPPIKHDNVKSAAVYEPIKEDTSALMTETLARVYLEQKKYQKAIQAYEILILKYPEKSTFFADRISEVKNLQQNNI